MMGDNLIYRVSQQVLDRMLSVRILKKIVKLKGDLHWFGNVKNFYELFSPFVTFRYFFAKTCLDTRYQPQALFLFFSFDLLN